MASIDGMEFTSVKAALTANEKRIAELEAAIRAAVETLNHIRGEAISTPPDWSSVDRVATDLRDELAKKILGG